MSDLISRQAVTTEIHNYFKGLIDKGIRNVDVVDCSAHLSKRIDIIPTAYDAGMIVEQLEKEYISARCNNNKPCNYPETIGCCYDKAITKAIEIVKGGGQGEYIPSNNHYSFSFNTDYQSSAEPYSAKKTKNSF